MSAETLRRAADAIREGSTTEAAGYEDKFMLAVADWLDRVARIARTTTGNPVYDCEARDALTVARAYLGESA